MRLLFVGGILTALSAAGAARVAPAPSPMPATAPSGAAAAVAAPQLTPEQTAFFEAKVRPIFVKNCYKCHSVEQGKSKGGLVLDTRDGWVKGGDTGPAVVPGDPGKSLMIDAISYNDQDLQMPPKGEKLSVDDIATLTAWVKGGAPDPRTSSAVVKLTGLSDKARAHWAYQAVKSPPVPEVKNAWVHTPIDAFVLEKLQQNKLTPSAAAQREVLIRRASYDLIGLPPTPEEVKAFVHDQDPKAYEKLIDRLLASPHYGERWGRYWLDTARYADTTGSDAKNEDYRFPYAWTYRDYVINSFNSDKPYDQFLLEQIAADKLPNADKNPDSLAALGFLTVGKRFPNKNDTIDERIDTVTKATMALTVSCARCHDHKFDPIPTADYYSLHGVFSSINEPAVKPVVGRQPSPSDVADFKSKMAELEQKNRTIYFNVVDEQSNEFRKKAAGYILASYYSNGPRRDPAKKLEAVRKYDLKDKGNGQLLTAAHAQRPGDPIFTPLQWFGQLSPGEFSQQVPAVLDRITHGNVKRGAINPLVVAAFKDVQPASLHNLTDVADVYGKLFLEIEPKAKAYTQANRTATGSAVAGYDDALVEVINTPIPVDPAPLITTDRLKSMVLGRTLALGNGAYNTFLFGVMNELELTHPGSAGRAMTVEDTIRPVDSAIFLRGDMAIRGKIVPRQFLEILSGPNRKPFTIGSGRLELAQAIATKDNPLTARVLVNRVWMHHFGEGFVRTPDDLGVQSETPSHPELLDYLAARFMQEGWSIKKLHKEIMLSSTYQQSSDTNTSYSKIDPYNRLLWRANLRRLDFEATRDTLLMFTGKLDRTIGGQSVNLTDEPYSNRRSIYGYVDRGRVPELMSQFDFSDPNRPNSHRTTTIVPQQALFFMNSPMSVDVARKVCSRPEFLTAHDDVGRVRALYAVLYQREAKAAEVQLAAQFYNTSVTSGALTAHPAAAPNALNPKRGAKLALGKGGNAKSTIQNEGTAVERTPLTIWQLYAQALLCTNEVVYVN